MGSRTPNPLLFVSVFNPCAFHTFEGRSRLGLLSHSTLRNCKSAITLDKPRAERIRLLRVTHVEKGGQVVLIGIAEVVGGIVLQ
jgi:hypothetical protein